MKRPNRRAIAATALGMDYGEMSHYHYQASRFRPPVYSVGDEYLVVGTPAELARASRFVGREFVPTTDTYIAAEAAQHGWIVGIVRD